MPDRDERDFFMRRKGAMEAERASFIPHYRELAEFIQPRRGRFLLTERNRGARRHQAIINSRASRAHRIARSGMFAGVMSPTRPWFKLETADPGLMRSQSVKLWLYAAETQIQAIFGQSNLYSAAPTLLGELLLFATGALSHVDDPATVARFYDHPAGSYLIAQDERHRVHTFVREFEMSAEQMVGQFGIENVSTGVKSAFDQNSRDAWFPVIQFIDLNPDFRPLALESRFKRFRSVYFEPSAERDRFLAREGFDEFPVYVPRWETTGEDIYGTNCSAMEALGDIKGLQIMERRKSQAIDKLVNPPLAGPPTLKNVPVSSLPGGVTIYDSDQNNQLRPIYQVDPRVGELRLDIQAVEQRINEAFFVDLFMAISVMPGIQPKNQLELSQRNEERLLQLGPVLQNVHGGFLAPLVDRTFNQAVRAGMIPDAPGILQGQPLKIRFISVLALAQRAVEVGLIERFSSFVGSVAQVDPRALDKYNVDEAIDQYAQLTGVVPALVVDTAQAEEVREQRAQAQAEAQAAVNAQAQGSAAAQVGSAVKAGVDAERTAREMPQDVPA